ncbi:hypothetical protein FNJ47_37105 [Bradyrhizobium sp. UFLA 03-164]|uniref:Acid-shock protein n=2 Tax=Bradyrhizobium uaiense TaxID=2594946 RepID=A0A6P1BSG4_9BRAD|nr:hypothetical protein [Bradyrhizobium uaiense]
MIGEADHPAGDLSIPKRRTTMLKSISAALLAMSVIAAPALAAETSKTATPAPATTTAPATTAPATKAAPVIKSEQLPSKVRNANAKMHHEHYRHHRHHKHMGMLKVKSPKHATKHASKHVSAKIATKHVVPAKRG